MAVCLNKAAGTRSLETNKLGQSGRLLVVNEDLADIWLILEASATWSIFLVYCADIDHFVDLNFGVLDVALLSSKQK